MCGCLNSKALVDGCLLICGRLDTKTLLERRARIMFVVVHRGTIKSGQADADERMRSRGCRTSSFKAQLPRVVNLQEGRFGKKEGKAMEGEKAQGASGARSKGR